MTLPLADIRVLQIGGLVEIPYAGRLLADLGADVLIVEPPDGARLRRIGPFSQRCATLDFGALHLHLNRGKRGITLNLDDPAGLPILRNLVASHDLILHDFDAVTADAIGLTGKEASHAISVAVTPFGQRGPRAHWRGYEINVQAMSGVVLGLGSPGHRPLPIPDFVTDFFVGAVASLAAMLGITARDKFGRGSSIDLAATDAWATFQTGLALVNWLFGAQAVQRGGQARRGGPYPNTILECKDGDYRLIAMTKREWVRFLDVMGNPEWGNDPRFQDRIKMNELYSDELDALISTWLRERTKREIFEACYAGGVPFTPINTFSDVLDDPQLAAREAWVQVERDDEPLFLVPRSPHGIPSPPRMLPSPAVGEHNFATYKSEENATVATLAELYASGVI